MRYAQDDYYDDEISMSTSFYTALVGGGIFLVGCFIADVKFIAGIGKVIMAIGGIIGFLGLAGIAMIILEAAVSIAIKAAFVIGAILLVGWIIKGIIQMINGKESASNNKSV